MGKKAKRKQHALVEAPRLPGGLAGAIRWPIYEVLLSHGWDNEAALVTIIVARQSPAGKIAFASFLVDLACLGVKSAAVRTLPTRGLYQQLIAHMLDTQDMAPAELDLVAKIIYAGVAYAADLGLKPDPVFHQAKHLLTGANPDTCPVHVPLGGPEGKPLFVSGPYDDARRIVEHLTQRVGEGNFHFIAPLEMVDDVEGLGDLVLLDEDEE